MIANLQNDYGKELSEYRNRKTLETCKYCNADSHSLDVVVEGTCDRALNQTAKMFAQHSTSFCHCTNQWEVLASECYGECVCVCVPTSVPTLSEQARTCNAKQLPRMSSRSVNVDTYDDDNSLGYRYDV
uniref:Uncharacterized protein n=1 Tax=Parascaris equorum TaxID=6256 RepID=A0A914RGY7_PAREQ